jgi:hypothetical protein
MVDPEKINLFPPVSEAEAAELFKQGKEAFKPGAEPDPPSEPAKSLAYLCGWFEAEEQHQLKTIQPDQ